MSKKCQMVVFSNKAYNAIIRESFDKDPVETGGILLGHILDNGVWIVMEVLPPGIKCIFERAYFEYDDAFVNYLAQSVANQYKISLELLGLWHRHPGSMDVFSSTDDGTNTNFALQNPSGVISGLVNIDPRFRLTMYHMESPKHMVNHYNRPIYERIDIEVGDDIIPDEYFELKYYDGEKSNLNPFVEHSETRMSQHVRTECNNQRRSCDNSLDIRNITENNLNQSDTNQPYSHDYEIEERGSWIDDFVKKWELLKKNKPVSLILMALILMILFILSIKTGIDYCKSEVETVISLFSNKNDNKPYIYTENTTLEVGDEVSLQILNIKDSKGVIWKSTDDKIASVNKYGKVKAKKVGEVEISLFINEKKIDECDIEVIPKEAQKEYILSETQLSLGFKQLHILELFGADGEDDIVWTSSDENIATVDDGKISTLETAGNVEITAQLKDKSFKCALTVKGKKIETPTFNIRPQIGDSKGGWLPLGYNSGKFSFSLEGEYDSNVIKELSWESSNPKVAIIDPQSEKTKCTIKLIGSGESIIKLIYKGETVYTYNLELKKN